MNAVTIVTREMWMTVIAWAARAVLASTARIGCAMDGGREIDGRNDRLEESYRNGEGVWTVTGVWTGIRMDGHTGVDGRTGGEGRQRASMGVDGDG